LSEGYIISIISISKIQHRRGLNENLPQLSSGEIGWSLDTRQIYIGRGSLADGAPEIGNTELLTEHSDVIAGASFTYEGNTGVNVVTGVDANNPIVRTLHDRLDEVAYVTDFGATGDGVTDDSAAVNRAIQRLVDATLDATVKARRTIFFPAGTYIMSSDMLRLLTYINVIGEGQNKTIIKMTDATQAAVVRTADSKNQITTAIGTNSATAPAYIGVSNLTFETTQDVHIMLLDSTTNSVFENVEFKGTFTNTDGLGNSKACIKISNDTNNNYPSGNIIFRGCTFTKNNFAVIIDDDIENIIFDACQFKTLYKGIVLGENTTGSIPSLVGPVGVKAIGCFFDNIDNQAYHIYNVDRNASIANTYRECGNNNDGPNNPVTPIVEFEAAGILNSTIGDTFDRSDTDNTIFSRIETNGSALVGVVQTGFVLGDYQEEPGGTVTLTGSSAVTVTTFSATTEETIEIQYRMKRGTLLRFGHSRIVGNTTAVTITDEFTENNGDIEIALSVSEAAGVVTLTATNTNASNTTMKYMIRKIV